MLKALQDLFGNGLDFLSARKARVNKHEKVAIGDVVLFEQAGQQKVGFIICHVSLKPSGSDKADAVTFMHVLTESPLIGAAQTSKILASRFLCPLEAF